MAIIYSIVFTLSLLLPAGYFVFVRKKSREPWLFVCFRLYSEFGLSQLSLSKTLEFAVVSNKVAYLGQVLVPLCMFMIISGLCGIKYKNRVQYVLIFAACAMFALVMTTGHLDWYYKSIELTFVEGAAKLVKEYGILHPINLVYVLSYSVAVLAVIGISVAGTLIDENNYSDVFGNGKVSFDPETYTLTLNGFNYKGEGEMNAMLGSGIGITSMESLVVELVGENSLVVEGGNTYGIAAIAISVAFKKKED